MFDIDTYLSRSQAISPAPRAIAAWSRIQDKPTSVVLNRNGTLLAAQTMRVEYDNTANENESAAGRGVHRTVKLFGIRNHPTQADTTIRKGDVFVLDSREFTVLDRVLTIGEVQAWAEVVS